MVDHDLINLCVCVYIYIYIYIIVRLRSVVIFTQFRVTTVTSCKA
jgi:hypothetical protein